MLWSRRVQSESGRGMGQLRLSFCHRPGLQLSQVLLLLVSRGRPHLRLRTNKFALNRGGNRYLPGVDLLTSIDFAVFASSYESPTPKGFRRRLSISPSLLLSFSCAAASVAIVIHIINVILLHNFHSSKRI